MCRFFSSSYPGFESGCSPILGYTSQWTWLRQRAGPKVLIQKYFTTFWKMGQSVPLFPLFSSVLNYNWKKIKFRCWWLVNQGPTGLWTTAPAQKYFSADPYRSSSAFWFKVAISLEAEHLQCQVVNTLKPPKNVPSLGERATRAEISESFTFFSKKSARPKFCENPETKFNRLKRKEKEKDSQK